MASKVEGETGEVVSPKPAEKKYFEKKEVIKWSCVVDGSSENRTGSGAMDLAKKGACSDSDNVLRSSGVESLMKRTCVDNSSDIL